METNYKITLIDDYEDTLDLLYYNLYKKGFETTTFSDSTEALNFISSDNTQLILTDWLMPDVDGLELVQRVKTNPTTRDIPIIMITCVNTENEIARALDVGVDLFLVKPFKLQELYACIDELQKKEFDQV